MFSSRQPASISLGESVHTSPEVLGGISPEAPDKRVGTVSAATKNINPPPSKSPWVPANISPHCDTFQQRPGTGKNGNLFKIEAFQNSP